MRQSPERAGRLVLTALVVGAAALLAGGAYWAGELRHSYRAMDLAYSESPQSFQAWLAQAWRAYPDRGERVAAISGRLLSVPIATRRRLAGALVDDEFWTGVASNERGRRALQEELREAALRALQRAPAAGDLWLAAAALHTRLDGFDDTAARYLAGSYWFAPSEGQVAYARARLIAYVLPILEGGVAEAAARDLALIEATYPALHRAMTPVLQAHEQQ